MTFPASIPVPPYTAVIFTACRTGTESGYAAMADRMEELASAQRGYLGIESVRQGDRSITVSYWIDEAAAREWKGVSEHLAAQRAGRERWYRSYSVRVARVERAYGFGDVP